MILFCDTSALVKLYVREDGSEQVAGQALASEAVAVCRIAWVEAVAAFARRGRERPADMPALAEARRRLAADWPHYLKLELTQDLVEQAGDFADTFALRAYDGVQLAAAHTLHREVPSTVAFACYDVRLADAARILGIGSI